MNRSEAQRRRAAMRAALDQAYAELAVAHKALNETGEQWKAAGARFKDTGLTILAIINDLREAEDTE